MNAEVTIKSPFSPVIRPMNEPPQNTVSLPIARYSGAVWTPADLPTLNGILSGIQIDRGRLEVRRTDVQERLDALTRQFAALTAEINALEDAEARLRETLNGSPPLLTAEQERIMDAQERQLA